MGEIGKENRDMFNINHIAISVSNKKASVEFYKKFGFQEFKS